MHGSFSEVAFLLALELGEQKFHEQGQALGLRRGPEQGASHALSLGGLSRGRKEEAKN